MQNVVIFGATSSIAAHTGRLFAQHGDKLLVVGRNAERLEAVAADLRIHGAHSVTSHCVDLDDTRRHAECVARSREVLQHIDVALLAYGILGDHAKAIRDADCAQAILQTNFISYVSLLTHLANLMESQERGVIAVISSVAGLRGRQSNYVYGAAKGGLNVFLAGLRNRLWAHKVGVLTIIPGFIDTPMTAAFKKGPLWSTPNKAAKRIYKAIHRRQDVIYIPWFWRTIMGVIRIIPERWFKRLHL